MNNIHYDYDFHIVKCLDHNCFGREFYIVINEDFDKRMKGKKDAKFSVMLICKKCGAEKIYGR